MSICARCGGLDGHHGLVHTRHDNGGGANKPCPDTVLAYQADVFGQRANDLFLAQFADEVLPTSGEPWTDAVTETYDNNGEVHEVIATIESLLEDAGYRVEWDNGVYLYSNV